MSQKYSKGTRPERWSDVGPADKVRMLTATRLENEKNNFVKYLSVGIKNISYFCGREQSGNLSAKDCYIVLCGIMINRIK